MQSTEGLHTIKEISAHVIGWHTHVSLLHQRQSGDGHATSADPERDNGYCCVTLGSTRPLALRSNRLSRFACVSVMDSVYSTTLLASVSKGQRVHLLKLENKFEKVEATTEQAANVSKGRSDQGEQAF